MKGKDTLLVKEEMLLSAHGQRRLLFYAQILDEIADYYKCKEPEVRLYTDRQKLWQDKLQAENGKIMENQLKDMACLLKNMATESVKQPSSLERCKKQIVKKLKENDMYVEEIYVMEHPNGRMEIGVCCHAKAGDYYSTQELAEYLSTIARRKLQPDRDCASYIHDEPVMIVCREELQYQVFHSVARATKTGEILSGDNYLVSEYDDGRELFVLSDGMGSGEDACDDSTMVVELFDRLLEAGITEKEAARQVNDVLCMRTRKLRTATLDVCRVNLCTGEATFLKCGAAPAYIKRGDEVFRVELQTLPLGIMQGEYGKNVCRFLEDGDLIILVTDGITDVYERMEEDGGEEALQKLIEQIDTRKPREFANQILGMAIRMDEGKIRDDMTVLVGVVMGKS